MADETARREFPPLRAGWSKRGQPTTVLISGRNGRRTILGALNLAGGELVHPVRLRGRTDDVLAVLAALGEVRPEIPKLLIEANAPPPKPHRVRAAAEATRITVAFLPYRSPAVIPLENLWRALKATVAATRCYASLEDLADRALDWLDSMSDAERFRRCGFQTSKLDWIPTEHKYHTLDRGVPP